MFLLTSAAHGRLPPFLLLFWMATLCQLPGLLAQPSVRSFDETRQAIQQNIDAFRQWYKPNQEYQVGLPTGSAATINTSLLTFPWPAENFLAGLKNIREEWELLQSPFNQDSVAKLLPAFLPKLESLNIQVDEFIKNVNNIQVTSIRFSAAVEENLTPIQQKLSTSQTRDAQIDQRVSTIQSNAAAANRGLSDLEKSEIAGLVMEQIQVQNDEGTYQYMVNGLHQLNGILTQLNDNLTDCLNQLNWADTQIDAAIQADTKAMEATSSANFNFYHQRASAAMEQLFIIL